MAKRLGRATVLVDEQAHGCRATAHGALGPRPDP